MDNIAKKLEDIFTQSIAICFPLMSDTKAIIRPSSHADYQCNSAMAIGQGLKKKGESMDPRSIADQLVKRLPQNDIVHEAQITGGFINIHLKQDFVNGKVLQLLKEGIHVSCDRQDRVVIDYSSPNIAKEMHVGHLRSTIIGDCIANVLEFLGHEVIRINHLGDWGTQFGMLLAYLMEKYPDYLDKPPAIGDLQKFYQEAKKRFDDDVEFSKKAKECVVKLQAKDPKFYKAWQMICDISRKEFEVIYEMLDVKGLKEMGESFYQDMMVEVVNDVKQKKLAVEEEGRLIMWPDPTTCQIPLTLVKSDGGFTYDTSDLACIKYRIQEQKASKIIYVTDSGQEMHIKAVKSAAILAGYLQPDTVNVQFVGFGVVTGAGGKKFKTRSGDTVRLRELLDEGLERAGAKLREKERDKEMTEEELAIAQKAVAMGCIKYSDLAHERVKNYEFSFDRMLDDRGNTAVYLLYSLARINSIIRKANLDQTVETIAQQTQRLNLSHIRELRLAKAILKFPEIILQVADTLMPHYLCGYLFDLSVIFSEFYEQCYCIEKVRGSGDEEVFKVNYDRILLCEATARILSKGLQLLGIKLVEKL